MRIDYETNMLYTDLTVLNQIDSKNGDMHMTVEELYLLIKMIETADDYDARLAIVKTHKRSEYDRIRREVMVLYDEILPYVITGLRVIDAILEIESYENSNQPQKEGN